MAYGYEDRFRPMIGSRRWPGNVRRSTLSVIHEGRRYIRRNPDPGHRSSPVEFVDGVCIVNTDGRIYQRRQMTPRQAPFGRHNGGLSEEFIAKNLKTETVVAGDLKFCVICQEGERERVGVLRCGHEYHQSCITVWLQNNNVCPLCKATAL